MWVLGIAGTFTSWASSLAQCLLSLLVGKHLGVSWPGPRVDVLVKKHMTACFGLLPCAQSWAALATQISAACCEQGVGPLLSDGCTKSKTIM